jgi:molybdate transport system ATP-binding protein
MINIKIEKKLQQFSINANIQTDLNKLVLFGPSGSGKSTLLKIIAGFFNPSQGIIKVRNKVLFDSQQKLSVPIYKRNIGYLPQNYSLFPNLTVLENIQYGLKAQKIKIDHQEIHQICTRLKIDNLLGQYPKKLSGGQQQRVALARILPLKPEMLLLDEPFNALDQEIRESLRDLVREISDQYQIPILLVTHNLEEASIFAEYIMLISNGSQVESGDSSMIFNHPQKLTSAKMMGIENLWPIDKKLFSDIVVVNGMSIRVNHKNLQEKTHIGIRAEEVMILRENKPLRNKIQENILSGTIQEITDRGKYKKIIFQGTNDLFIQINMPVYVFRRLNLFKGKTIKVSLKMESLVLCQQ